MEKQYLLFDLDGTLTDPMAGITKSVQYALRHYGIEESNLEKLTCFIGPPLTDSFQKYFHFSQQQAREAVLVYREYFTERGIFENEELPGIRKMLKKLKAEGKTLIVATSKPEIFAKQIIRHFQFEEFISFVCGADMEETRVKKGDVIRYALKQASIREDEKSKCVMVGDREHDIIGAKENGLESIGVLFGYGSRQELEKAGADQIAENVQELEKMLL